MTNYLNNINILISKMEDTINLQARNDLTEVEMKHSLLNIAFTLAKRNAESIEMEVPFEGATGIIKFNFDIKQTIPL